MLMWNEAAARTPAMEIVRVDGRLLDEAGNLEALLSGHADHVLAEAAPTESRRVIAEKLFRALTDINAEGQAIRRPQSFDELVAVCGGAEAKADLRAVIDAFRADGVSFLTPYQPEAIEGRTVIDIGHKAVIRCWGKIADDRDGWLTREFRDGRAWASLVVQAKRFATTKGDLLSPASTEETGEWLRDLNENWAKRYGGEWNLVQRLQGASLEARDEAERSARLGRIMVAFTVLVLAGFGSFAFWEWQSAEKAQRAAQSALALANKTANGLVVDLAQKFRWAYGVQANVVSDILDRALTLTEELAEAGATSPELQYNRGKALLEAVQSRLAMGQTAAANSAARQALEILQRLVATNPGNGQWRAALAESYFRLSGVQKAQGDLKAALKSCSDSLAISQQLANSDPGNATWQHRLATAYQYLGDVQHAQSDYETAMKSYSDYFAIGERLAKSDPANATWQNELSVSYERIGDVQQKQGDLEAALKSHSESLAIRERLAKSDPSNTKWLYNVATAYGKIGDVQEAQGDLQAALKSYSDDLAVRERLAKSDPSNAGWQRELSVSYVRIGDVQEAQGDLQAALKSYSDSLAIAERLATSDPGNTQWQRDLSVNYERNGDVQTARGDLQAALKSYSDSLAIAERLAKSDPGNTQWQRDLSVSYIRVGDVQKAQGDLKAALRSYSDEVVVVEKMAESGMLNHDVQPKYPYHRLAEIYRELNELPKAREVLNAGLAILSKLAKDNPDEWRWASDLSFLKYQLAELDKVEATKKQLLANDNKKVGKKRR